MSQYKAKAGYSGEQGVEQQNVDSANSTVVEPKALTSSQLLNQLSELLRTRLPENGGNSETSYVAKLLHKGPDAFLKKIGEESAELIMACKDAEHSKIIYETADLWFHSLIVLTYYGITFDQVVNELARRQNVSGLVEKLSRNSN